MRGELIACSLVFLLSSIAAAQGRRLNAPFPPDSIGAVSSFTVGPNGRTVYAADQDVQGSVELYDAPSDGSAPPVRLAAPAMSVTATLSTTVSADGQRLVYRTDAFGGLPERFNHLYSVRMDGGGAAVDLSGTLVSGGSVMEYAVGPARVVYRCDALVDETFELFSAPLDGSAPAVRLSAPLVAGGDVVLLELSPDGARVVYWADAAVNDAFELFSVPADGSAAPVRLHQPLTASQDTFVLGALFSPDSSRVLFVSDMELAGTRSLFSVPSDGSAAPLRLNPAYAAGRTVTAYAVSPLSDRVAYLADQDVNDEFELFGVPLTGGATVQLSGALVSGGDVYTGFRIGPGGVSVAYVADELVDGRSELFGVPLDGSSPSVRLNGPLQAGSNVGTFRFAADGARVAYYANEGSATELHSAPIDASAASLQLSGPSALNESPFELLISDDGRALYLLQTVSCVGYYCTDTIDLYSVPLDGSAAPVRLNTNAGEDVLTPALDPASGRVVFRYSRTPDVATQTSAYELYSVPTAGGPPPVKLHPALDLGGSRRDVVHFQLTPDGRWALYAADQDADDVLELYRASTDGRDTPVKLNGPVSSPGLSPWFTLGPDSVRVVYLPAGVSQGLTSARIDGTSPPVALGSGPGASPIVLISPDGARVVYQEAGQAYGVPIDGSASPIPLLGSLVPGGSLAGGVLPPEGISPDSSRLVFVADRDTDETHELYSVLLDGSAAPVKLSGVLVPGGDVLFSTGQPPVRISPDGTRVAYVADASVDGVTELFSVPLDGSAAPLKLSGTLVTGGDVDSTTDGYAVSPDSTRVVYRADQVVNGRFELFSVPLDGSAPPVVLNASLPTGGDVAAGVQGTAFAIGPDSARVVYRADQAANDRFELFSVPLDGSAPPVKLSGPMIAAGDVDFLPFTITSDSLSVVYAADAEADERPQLFAVPLDGSALPVKLGMPAGFGDYQLCPDGSALVFRTSSFPTLVAQLHFVDLDGTPAIDLSRLRGESDVSAYALRADSLGVLYIADQNEDELHELWLAGFPRAHARPR